MPDVVYTNIIWCVLPLACLCKCLGLLQTISCSEHFIRLFAKFLDTANNIIWWMLPLACSHKCLHYCKPISYGEHCIGLFVQVSGLLQTKIRNFYTDICVFWTTKSSPEWKQNNVSGPFINICKNLLYFSKYLTVT